jgi:DNA-binding MarR family transcriptional regulator
MPVDAVHRRIIADLRAAGFADLSDAHMAVLRYPGPQGRRPSDLAAEVGMSKQAVNYLLGALEQAGYVQRSADPDDRRSRRIELTDRGEQVRRTIRATVAEIESELAEELGTHAFEQLRALLVKINETSFVRGSDVGHPAPVSTSRSPRSTESAKVRGRQPMRT